MLPETGKIIYRSSDSGTFMGSRVIVGRIRWVPSDIHPWAVLLKVGRLIAGSLSSGYRGGFKSTSGSLKVMPLVVLSKPPKGVATLKLKSTHWMVLCVIPCTNPFNSTCSFLTGWSICIQGDLVVGLPLAFWVGPFQRVQGHGGWPPPMASDRTWALLCYLSFLQSCLWGGKQNL